MIPRIFVSSTIKDLQHVRDAIRELILELGYQPAMSEFGEVGFLPEASAADSCYRETADCDFGILIIGKRYGDDHRDNMSVTQNEYRALASKVPIITLVEKDLLSYRAVFQANPTAKPSNFPGMDRPDKTFSFLDEVANSPKNNGIAEFKHIGEARFYVRLQLAHIFGSLLRKAYDPVKGEVRDILAEVRALRSELITKDQQADAIKYLHVSRALLEDRLETFREFLEKIFGNPDQPVKSILDNKTFDELLRQTGLKIKVFPTFEKFQQEYSRLRTSGEARSSTSWSNIYDQPEGDGKSWQGGYAFLTKNRLFLNETAIKVFRDNFDACRASAGA
jgi:hypothetical protein